jgi:CMP-N-acetylneuraminic acid synthetase
MLPKTVTSSPPTTIDTGATGHYVQCSFPLLNMTTINKGIAIFPNLKYGSLLSVGNFVTMTVKPLLQNTRYPFDEISKEC